MRGTTSATPASAGASGADSAVQPVRAEASSSVSVASAAAYGLTRASGRVIDIVQGLTVGNGSHVLHDPARDGLGIQADPDQDDVALGVVEELLGNRVQAERREDAGVRTPFRLHGIPQEFLDHAKRDVILSRIGLDAQTIARGIVEDVTAGADGRALHDVEHRA